MHWKAPRGNGAQPEPRGQRLSGVTATSASNAWAVGAITADPGQTLIERWNGTAWMRVPSPTRINGAPAST